LASISDCSLGFCNCLVNPKWCSSKPFDFDFKAPIESYLDALQATDQAQRDSAFTEHLKKVRSHIDLLSKKDDGKLSS